MEIIFIPRIANTFDKLIDKHLFYVVFPQDKEREFHEWCTQNNIGREQHNRKDITAAHCAVFTLYSNKHIFI